MLQYYDAIAQIAGCQRFSEIYGTVKFLKISDGSWVEAELFNLPEFDPYCQDCQFLPTFDFSIHEKGTCGSSCGDCPFLQAGQPLLSTPACSSAFVGEMPSVFSNGGTSKLLFFTNRFFPEDIVGRSVVVQARYLSRDKAAQAPPMRIACGYIAKYD